MAKTSQKSPQPQSQSQPKFTIIVPAFNVVDYIETAINSVLTQDYGDFELIVIDDSSTDGTRQLAQHIIDSRLHVLRQPHSGVAAARNLGVARAKGEYILFLDGDDFFAPHALAIIADNLTDNPDLLRFQAQDFHPDGQVTKYPERAFAATTGLAAFPILQTFHYLDNDWAYAYNRNFWRTHNFQYAEGYLAEDFGLTPLIIASAQTVKSITVICYNYRQRSSSIMHDHKKLKNRASDALHQLQITLPKLTSIPGSEPVAHYLVASALTLAAKLKKSDFQKLYRSAQQNGYLQYLKVTRPKSLPRTLAAKYAPSLFYRLYHDNVL